MKLSLSNNILMSQRTVDLLNDALLSKKHLQYLDLSWGSLGPRGLMQITDSLRFMLKQIRDLNLSYNMLHFEKP